MSLPVPLALRAFVLVSLGAAGLGAQVPYRYLVTAEGSSTSLAVFHYLDPATGAVTPVVNVAANGGARSAGTVALDPQDPFSLWFQTATGTNVPAMTRAGVLGSRIHTVTSVTIRAAVGPTGRYHVAGSDMLFTQPGGSLPGLHLVPLVGGTAQQLLALPGAHELVVHNGKAYVASHAPPQPTTVVEVDLTSRQNRVLGTAYPAARALTPFGPNLLLGDDAGDVHLLDVLTGNITLLQRAAHGAVVAAATDPLGALFYYATDRNEIWRFPDLGRPLYATANRIYDIDVGVHDRAAFLQFGTGCDGTNGRPPRFDHVGIPSLNHAGFALHVIDARANAPCVLALGPGRRPPLALDVIGMLRCTLYLDPLVPVPVTSDGSGRAVLPFPIANDPLLRDAHFVAQGFVVDPGANPFGLVASDGGEGIVR